MSRIILLFCISLLVSACVTNPLARINAIRAEQMPKVARQMSAMKLEPGAHAYIRIFKEEAVLEAWLRNEQSGQYHLYKTYPICTYSGALGPKLYEGDLQSPEGFYALTEELLQPQSQYHLALNIGYPNAYDEARGRTGSLLMIHGGCQSEGCYAMTDRSIEEIYLLVEQSLAYNATPVPVHIFPFRMTEENMARFTESTWYPFWTELSLGYHAFERNRVLPLIQIRNGRYRIRPQVFVARDGG